MRIVMTAALKKRLLKMINDPLAQLLLGDSVRSDEVFYLGLSTTNSNYISYIDKSKLERYGPTKKWYSKYRYHGRPGKVIQKIFPNTDNCYYEAFSNAFIAAGSSTKTKSKFKFKIVEKEDIRKYYHIDTYANTEGSLGASCMRGDGQQSYLDIYVHNPDHVKMAIMTSDAGLEARCLLWYPNADKSVVYFDRIYAGDAETEMSMYQWCISKKYIQISNKNIIKPTKTIEIRIPLKNLTFKHYPYVDTIRYINGKDINNVEDGDVLHHTNGMRNPQQRCPHCGTRHDTRDDFNEIVAGSYEGQIGCPECTVYSAPYNGYISLAGSIYCGYTDARVPSEFAVRLYNRQYCWAEYPGLLKDYCGSYFINGDENFVTIEGKWYNIDSSKIELVEGEYKLKAALEERIEVVNYSTTTYTASYTSSGRWFHRFLDDWLKIDGNTTINIQNNNNV